MHLERSQRLFGIDPMFGSGMTRLQPAYVEDVAEAIVRALQQTDHVTFECGGPRLYTYEESHQRASLWRPQLHL